MRARDERRGLDELGAMPRDGIDGILRIDDACYHQGKCETNRLVCQFIYSYHTTSYSSWQECSAITCVGMEIRTVSAPTQEVSD